ncbi:uncharacterized protein LOC111045548 isoform X2 [Nilaparvata lugens]|nr:uncharacterized protein LOC111045548 isoform X2 [Nilaparvata lugens]
MTKSIIYTILMIIMMMFISSVILDISQARRDEYLESFKVFDYDKDGFITKGDTENYLEHSEFEDVLSEHQKKTFKKSIMAEIDKNGGRISQEAYILFMDKMDQENPSANVQSVRNMFPGKRSVTKDELCSKIPGLIKEHLNDSYTIEEIVELVYFKGNCCWKRSSC